MGQTLSFSYYLRQGRAVLLRCFGDTPCPVLPETLDGAPLAALAGYCFSDKEPSLPAGTQVLRWGEDFSHPLCGNFVESISLPQSLESVGSSAFYNCRRLEKLEFSASLTQVGSDAFMNCDELALLRLDGLPRDAGGLRQMLAQLQRSVTVEFAPAGQPAARLLFPEFYEELEENIPAHIFQRQVVGVGYRYRQCFAGQSLLLTEYDRVFDTAAAQESSAVACQLAMLRLGLPLELAPAAEKAYLDYLTCHAGKALCLAVEQKDADTLAFLLQKLNPSAEARQTARTLAQRLEFAPGAALLTQPAPRTEKSYDF